MKLQIKDDTGKTHSVPLTRDEITIGRKEGNTIRLTERNVSRTHARFLRKGEEIHVEDLSRYGTRVNGERITETRRVGSGDVIQIGDYLISLEGVKPVDENAVADQKLAAAGAAAAAPAAASAAKAPAKDVKADKASDKDAKAKPPIPEGYAMKTMPDGSISADDVRKSLGAGKKRIGASHPTLVAVSTHLAGTEFPISGTTMVLGRTGENDIKIDHQSISSNHAKVVVADGRVKMVDLKSKNGIRVNGEYWEESTLKSGDIIELGKVQFRFVDKGEEFVYRPEDYVGGAKKAAVAAAPVVEEKKGSKAWIVILLLLVAGGAVAAFVLSKKSGPEPVANTTKPTETAKPTEPPPTTAPTTLNAVTVPSEADAGATPQADVQVAQTEQPDTQPTQAPEVVQNSATAELMKKAQDSAKAQKWDEAKDALSGLLALDPNNAEAKGLMETVEAERTAGSAFAEYQAASAKKDLPGAWAALQKLAGLKPESQYYAQYQEAKTAVEPALANYYADQAQNAYNRKAWAEAIRLAEEAKKITFNHARAEEIIQKAKKKQREEKEANNTNNTTNNTTTTSTKTPKELYDEGRSLHNSNPAGALKAYEGAASKGYPAAYKQIGSIKVKLGDTGGAILAYKRYLSLVPSANDADMVKDIIVRLGGTP